MDTAQKLLKTSAIPLAIALLMAAPGWAQPTLLAPATVTIGNTGSNSASVTSSAAGTTEITYTIGAVDYSGDTTGAPTGWLMVSGGTTTPSNLNFSVRTTSGLSQGSSATVTLTPAATVPPGAVPGPVTITVVFNGSSGGGGGSGTLSASSNPVNLTAAASSQTSANVNITTSSVSAITIQLLSSVTSGGTNWLSTSISNNSLSSAAGTSFTIIANSFNLAPGFAYQGTVTVTPSTGTPLNITVNFSVGGSGSNGTWTASPSTIPWSFTTNSGTFPTQVVSVSTTSGQSLYNVVTTSSNGWLVLFSGVGDVTAIPGITVGTSFTLKVGTQANALAAGQYSGQAIISDSNSNEQIRVTVNLTVNGGNSAGLSINPSTVTFTPALNGAQQSQVVNVTSNTGGILSVTGALPTGLSYSLPANSNLAPGETAGITTFANPFGLAANTYTGTLQIVVGSQSGTVNVNMIVGGGGSGGTGTTAVAPTSLNFAYQFGTNLAFVARQKLVITGPAGAWSSVISNGSTWLRLSPGGGSALPNPASDGDTPIVSIDPTDLTVGSYAGTISITTAGGTQTVQVSLNVVSGAVLLPTPGALIFNAQTGQANPAGQALFFSISDSTLLPSLSISAVSNNPWIILSGPTPSSVTVRVDQTGLGTGTYSGSIAVSQTGVANSTTTIPILLVVNGGGGGSTFGTLTFSQNPIGFTSVNGSTPNSTTLSVGANASTSFVGSITYTNGSGWLNVNPLSGITPANLSVSVSPAGLAANTYNATISFNANGVIQTVGVTLTVSTSSVTGNVTVSLTSLTFTSLSGASPAGQSITVNSASGAAGVPFTVQVTAGSSWLSTSAIANPTTSYSFTVNVNSNVMQAGSYPGNILITPNGGTAVNVPVNLTIAAPSAVSATPTTLTFDYRAGDSAPSPKQLTVSGGGATLTYAVTPSSTGNWLVVSPAAGTTPGTVNVSIDPTGLSTGVYNGSVLVAGAGGAPGSTTVTVTLNVTVPLPTVTKVTNAASYATGLISPGEIITLFAGDPTHPIGPATAAGLALDSTGKVSTTIGGVQVTVNGYFCPMIYASASQVSAVVPYEVKGFVTATVLVKFLGQSSNGVLVNVATTVPGVFTSNSSGTGPGAILNSNSTTNSPGNPATRGDTVVVYLTGEGETSPAGVTGKVTTVAAPPQPLTPGPLLQPSVTIGGQPAQWSFAGEAPTFVSGVMQLNVVVPTNIAAGDQFIVVSIGGNPSQPGVTVSLR